MENLEEKKIIYEKYYKIFTFLSISLFILSLIYLAIYYSINGEFFKKDITLTGGTVITLYGNYEENEIKQTIKKYTNDFLIKYTQDLYTNKIIATIIETKLNEDDAKKIIEELKIENYNIETTTASLGKNFFNQLMIALFIAIIFMIICVFLIFRTFVPSIAVILAALTDICASLAIINIMNISIGTAGIVALLMLIGYSVDSDILLTTRVLKRKDTPLKGRLISSLKTGLTTTLTSLIVVFIGFIFSTSNILKQIFLVLSIGLTIDLFSTWIGNISILTWYIKKKYKE
ncbi:MAG: MMPL family transporter [Candidatus Pacearchaeota archaeon]